MEEKALFPLAASNTHTLMTYFDNLNTNLNIGLITVNYPKNKIIVNNGKIGSPYLASDNDFSYAEVPLGYIVKGDVIVTKGGKATKHLSEGDFIGLFETSDWILTGKKREIGDWTLKTSSETQILYFSAQSLRPTDQEAKIFDDYLVNLARTDRVPQPITNMPLLDWVADHTTKSRISDHVIVIHTHLLPNSFPFFRHLSYLTDFGKIYVLEKPYSTVKDTYNDLVQAGCEIVQVQMEPGMPYEFSVKKSIDILWAKIIEEQKVNSFKRLLVIDDGGDLWHSIPWRELKGISIAGVEQTQRGITRVENSHIKIPPIISVASSGIKKTVESIFIGESIINKLAGLGYVSPKYKIGILGMGSIGLSAAEKLNKLGHKVIFYDTNPNILSNAMIESCSSLDDLLNQADLIIGTTGKDSLKGIAFDRVSGHKILASASSADVEFASLLKIAQATDRPFDIRHAVVNEKLNIDILNGGYPLNFDREKNAVPDEDIALTWCLMYTGAMQAAVLLKENKLKAKIYDVDHQAQKKTLERWIETSNSKTIVNKNDVDQIIKNNNLHGDLMQSVWKD
ncbi:MAG: NAD(P)-dependent oxidoreductase [bacterium]